LEKTSIALLRKSVANRRLPPAAAKAALVDALTVMATPLNTQLAV